MYNDYKTKLTQFYNRDRRMPTYSEMMKLFGFKSKNAVARLVDKFIEEGIVSKDYLGRLIADTSFDSIPMLGSVKAGFPSDAEELKDTINIDDYLIAKKDNSYMLTVDGDSMIDAHIADGDMVLVEKTNTAKDGQIVIANVDGEFTMKYFRKDKENKVWLEPANKDFKPIYPKMYLNITAVVKAVIRKY
ncbi:TPA: repressor LexA [Candidatus Nomurabacteria bacterium]|nr:MAG: LexA repressor [Candidatus Nomurabacteria bacterium GW2011_GWE2_36_115]KKP94233.1 MAG: LexA repressor [Candidatus Nomurabacteria bacterium GW2011_GWF2_36_126]KKP96639.1 MAG: LexA repressor [Candidatus Nomurabacteria bacterium GW2011_GWD2_36_14]KKP99757.1 MAG: LexA repressor [Candidatus Nomurabacteria bacterium GW2011_GWF2_36_19]KKQ05297.1 MAG: LexA repressor [Candidatus Nomurabacteria bacterium GW2011_GWF1_36_47]KKQ08976.1 MAG: LexA repressor [Candidatus Nomurabacteria bacterium GW2011